MRTANAYQSLNEAHDRMNGDTALPGTRYEAVRETQYGLDDRMARDGAARPEPEQARPSLESRMDSFAERLAALDKELSEMRAEMRGPGATHQQSEADMDRLFALHGQQGQPEAEPSRPKTTETQERIGPERWTNNAGRVEQEQMAREWHAQIIEQRQQQSAPERGQDSGGLSPEAASVLNAAREHEAEGQQQQERDRGQARDYPAP